MILYSCQQLLMAYKVVLVNAYYCNDWGLSLNYNKTKVMIFNKSGKCINQPFAVNNNKIECVKEYKYLGLLISCNGNFTAATNDLFNRGQKAFFKLKSSLKQGDCNISTVLKTFDHTVKPVLLYSSEVWDIFNMTNKFKKGSEDLIFNIYNDHKIEKLNLKFLM